VLKNLMRTARPFRPGFLLTMVAAAGWVACGPPEPVLVGVLIPESGTAAIYGKSIRQGIELAVETVNEKGGIQGGRMVEVDIRDTGTNPLTAELAAQDLL